MSTSEYPTRRFGAPRLTGPAARDRLRSFTAEGWIVFALVIAAAVIRILVIDNQSLWADEALTSYEARLGFGPMISVVEHFETTPPLYFVMAWGWGHLFGTGAVALRSLSTIAGAALVPVAYLATRELVGRVAGVLAAAFVTFNPFLIWYSQEARAYMLLTLLSGASFLWFVKARADPSRRNLIWWAGWSSLALATHFFAAFLVAPEALWLLWLRRDRVAAVAVAAVALVEAAMIPFAVADTGHGTGWIAAEPLHNRISQTFSEWGASILYRRTPIALGLIGGAVLVALVAILTRFGGDRRTRDAVKVGATLGACVWIGPLLLKLAGQDYFLSRNVMPAVVPFAVALAAACAAPRTRLLGGALAAALLALFAVAAIKVQTRPYLERPNWRAVAHALGPARVPRVILAADGTTADPLKIYLAGAVWSEPANRRLSIREVDVVGAIKRLSLIGEHPTLRPSRRVPVRSPVGKPFPARVAPPGAHLLVRFRLGNWVLARFGLERPIRVTINQLVRLAPRFFVPGKAPVSLLVFFQRPVR